MNYSLLDRVWPTRPSCPGSSRRGHQDLHLHHSWCCRSWRSIQLHSLLRTRLTTIHEQGMARGHQRIFEGKHIRHSATQWAHQHQALCWRFFLSQSYLADINFTGQQDRANYLRWQPRLQGPRCRAITAKTKGIDLALGYLVRRLWTTRAVLAKQTQLIGASFPFVHCRTRYGKRTGERRGAAL